MTYNIILGLALVVAALGCLVRRRSAALGHGMVFVGCLGAIACVAWQVRETMFTTRGAGPDRGQAVVGYFLANQALGQISQTEGAILLFFPPQDVIDEETAGTYAGTFARVLRGVPGLKIQALTLKVPTRLAKTGQIPLTALQEAATNAPPAVAYVSFAGVPADIKNFRSSDPKLKPQFFVFDPWATTNWLESLKDGLIRCVIVPKPGVQRTPGEEISGEPNEVFNRLYLLATPATAGEIAAQLGQPASSGGGGGAQPR